MAGPGQNLLVELCHNLDLPNTFVHVENDISTINRVIDKASGPHQDHLLARPDTHFQVKLFHDLDRVNTFERVENVIPTIRRVRD